MDAGRAFDGWIDRGRWPLLAAVAAITVWLGGHALTVPLDRDSEALTADDRQARAATERLRAAFPDGETVLFTVTRPDLLEPPGLRSIEDLTARLEGLAGVRRVDSLANVVELIPGPFGAEPRRLFPETSEDSSATQAIERAIDRNPHLVGLLISADRETAGWIIEPERSTDPDTRDSLLDRLVALVDDAPAGEDRHLTGTIVLKREVARLVARDQSILLPASVAVLAAALGIAFRRRSAVVLPIAVTSVAVVWTLGLYSVTGHSIHVLTSLLPPLLMTVSVSTAVHLYARWASPRDRPTGSRERARETVVALAGPCFLTALTTALGLLSLTLSDLPAVRQFGLFGAIGVGISFVLNLTLLPLAFAVLRPPGPGRPHRSSRTEPVLARIAGYAVRRPGFILALTAAVAVLGIAGTFRIRNNTDLLQFLDPDAPRVRDARFVDAHLTGTAVLELMIERGDREPWGAGVDDLVRLASFQDNLRKFDRITGVLGLPDLIKAVRRAETGDPEADVPEEPGALADTFDILEAAEDPTPVRRVLTEDRTATRLLVRVHSTGSARAAALFGTILTEAERTLGPDVTVTPGGPFHAVVVDSNRLVQGLARSVVLALVTVLSSLALLFRSPKVLLAAAVPNVVPVLAAFGFMGFAGIDLSTGTAMIASVVLGIAVDDTIHWLARFRESRAVDTADRAVEASRLAGRPLLIASTVLVLGFWVGALGSFQPTVYFSVLTGATILIALVCDLVVLPACLVLLQPRRSSSPRS